MPTHRTHATAVKRQVVQEYLAGETLHGLAKRHNVSRTLIRIWVKKYEADEFNDDEAAAVMLQQYEARIAALERLVGKLSLEKRNFKGASKKAHQPKNASISVVAGPVVWVEELRLIRLQGTHTLIPHLRNINNEGRFKRDRLHIVEYVMGAPGLLR